MKINELEKILGITKANIRYYESEGLFESGDPILQELGVSVVIGVIIMFVIELFKSNGKRIENLEKRIENLEKNKIL